MTALMDMNLFELLNTVFALGALSYAVMMERRLTKLEVQMAILIDKRLNNPR